MAVGGGVCHCNARCKLSATPHRQFQEHVQLVMQASSIGSTLENFAAEPDGIDKHALACAGSTLNKEFLIVFVVLG